MPLATQMKKNLSGANTDRSFSPAIWADCPTLAIKSGMVPGIIFEDDFENLPTFVAGAASVTGKYAHYGDTGVIVGGALAQYGICQVSGNDDDNDEGTLHAYGAPFIIDTTKGKLWFETRMKIESVANDGVSFFNGLAAGATSGSIADAEALVDDTGAVKTDETFLGFRTLSADGDQIELVCQKESLTLTDMDVSAMVADTYIKLGFTYDPSKTDAFDIYVNNIELAEHITSTQVALTAFPDEIAMSWLLATKVGTATENIVSVDWIKIVQLG